MSEEPRLKDIESKLMKCFSTEQDWRDGRVASLAMYEGDVFGDMAFLLREYKSLSRNYQELAAQALRKP